MKKLLAGLAFLGVMLCAGQAKAGTGYAGSPSPEVTTVQGIGGMTPFALAYSTTTTANLVSASINFSTTGDNVIVSTSTTRNIRVYQMILTVGAATNLIFKDGETNLTGAMNLAANGSITLDFNGEPWFIAVANDAFIINQSGTAQVSGRIYYEQ